MKSIHIINKFKAIILEALSNDKIPAHWKTEFNELMSTVQQAFGGKNEVLEAELPTIATQFQKLLTDLVAANTAWSATNFDVTKKPTHHLAADFADFARISFNNAINYAHTPLAAGGAADINRKVLAQTKQASLYGYQCGDTIVYVDPHKVQQMQSQTKRYDTADIDKIPLTPKYANTQVRVITGDSFVVANTLRQQGYNPIVLNMANPDAAGGGAEAGGFAQEESLYYRSNYFMGLDRNYNPGTALYPMPEFGGIYTPHVQVIRNEKYEFAMPWSVAMVASAAYIAPKVSDEKFRTGTEKKIEAILKIAAAQNHDCVVLGAYGCGAFRKDENTKVIVADLFQKVIKKPEFSGQFRNISFAILYDHGNDHTFRDRLTLDLQTDLKQAREQAKAKEQSKTVEVALHEESVKKANEFADKALVCGLSKDRTKIFYEYYQANMNNDKKLLLSLQEALALAEKQTEKKNVKPQLSESDIVAKSNSFADRAVLIPGLFANRDEAFYKYYHAYKKEEHDAIINLETTLKKYEEENLKKQKLESDAVANANRYASEIVKFNGISCNRDDAFYKYYNAYKAGDTAAIKSFEDVLKKSEQEFRIREQSLNQFLTTPFQPAGNCFPYDYTRLKLNVDLTAHYEGRMPIPRTPFFHPYDPNGATKDHARAFAGIPGAIVTVRCPKAAIQHLPLAIQEFITINKIDMNKIELFFVNQNQPWKDPAPLPSTPLKKCDLLFRTHYWVHGQPENNASIANNSFSLDTPCRMGIFSSTNPNLTCDGAKDVVPPNFLSVNSHPGVCAVDKPATTVVGAGTPAAGAALPTAAASRPAIMIPMIISSPANTGVMAGYNFEQTDSLYSVALTKDGRMAITLHWLLNPQDQEALSQRSKHIKNMYEFIQAVANLKNSRLNIANGPLHHLVTMLNTKVVANLDLKHDGKSKGLVKNDSKEEDEQLQRALVASRVEAHSKAGAGKDEKHQGEDAQLKAALEASIKTEGARRQAATGVGSAAAPGMLLQQAHEQLKVTLDVLSRSLPAKKVKFEAMIKDLTECATKFDKPKDKRGADTKVKDESNQISSTATDVMTNLDALNIYIRDNSGNGGAFKTTEQRITELRVNIQTWDDAIRRIEPIVREFKATAAQLK